MPNVPLNVLEAAVTATAPFRTHPTAMTSTLTPFLLAVSGDDLAVYTANPHTFASFLQITKGSPDMEFFELGKVNDAKGRLPTPKDLIANFKEHEVNGVVDLSAIAEPVDPAHPILAVKQVIDDMKWVGEEPTERGAPLAPVHLVEQLGKASRAAARAYGFKPTEVDELQMQYIIRHNNRNVITFGVRLDEDIVLSLTTVRTV